MKKLNESYIQKMATFIEQEFCANNGISPSFNEIMQYMEMSNSVCYRYLLALRDRGIINYSGRGTLSIKSISSKVVKFQRTPIMGVVSCGPPEDNREQILGYLAIPEEWIDGDCFLLQASGDSMIDIGISPGDLVLIKKATRAYDGQVVAVLTETGTTVKRYRVRADGVPWLFAENHNYPEHMKNLYPSEIIIQGLALKVIKDVK